MYFSLVLGHYNGEPRVGQLLPTSPTREIPRAQLKILLSKNTDVQNSFKERYQRAVLVNMTIKWKRIARILKSTGRFGNELRGINHQNGDNNTAKVRNYQHGRIANRQIEKEYPRFLRFAVR